MIFCQIKEKIFESEMCLFDSIYFLEKSLLSQSQRRGICFLHSKYFLEKVSLSHS